jgi:hypothetical protein
MNVGWKRIAYEFASAPPNFGSMQFARFMDVSTFLRELDALRAFRGEYVGADLLERLEASGLLVPRLRIRLPEDVARRFWFEAHPETPRAMKHPTEPDGPRWDDAIAFSQALHRAQKWIAYGVGANPLDDPEPRFAQFIEQPSRASRVPHLDRRVDISNDEEETLFDDNCDDRYTTWQLLLAAEQADAGVRIRMDLDGDGVLEGVGRTLEDGRLPEGRGYRVNFEPVYASREFRKHEKTLDAVVWFVEERWRVLSSLVKGQGGRFRLTTEQGTRYAEATSELAAAACRRFGVGLDDLVELIRCFAKRWSDWTREGRPLIANAYKEFLEGTVLLVRRFGELNFTELRDRVGKVGGWHEPVLDLIWPDWTAKEKERVSGTLKSNLGKFGSVTDADINAFVEFLANKGLEALFWRLNSFENHAFRGNEFAIEGMKSDIQGMAVAVEHAAEALGATETQLYEKYKQLWKNPDVLALLKDGKVSMLARQSRLLEDWPALKAEINAIRSKPGGEVAADLVMAHRIRGGVHTFLPEDDQFELESLFTGLMRAALLTFIEARGTAAASC